jgi:multidrug efflux pump subunit AcrA (membrane-fusion protein)
MDRGCADGAGGPPVNPDQQKIQNVFKEPMMKPFMSKINKPLLGLGVAAALSIGAAIVFAQQGTATKADAAKPEKQLEDGGKKADKPAAGRAALTVTASVPQSAQWPITVAASGSIAAWQEAIVGSEVGGLRLAEVAVNVGDPVRKGQVLARFATESVAADVAAQKAAVAEAQATINEAQANAAQSARSRSCNTTPPRKARRRGSNRRRHGSRWIRSACSRPAWSLSTMASSPRAWPRSAR